jgi:hypothetical protein
MAKVDIELRDEERSLFVQGLGVWEGAAHPSPSQIVAFGFNNVFELGTGASQLAKDIAGGKTLARRDWNLALILIEVGFSSMVQGASYDWEIVSGFSDLETLTILRSIQKKLWAIRLRWDSLTGEEHPWPNFP